MTEISFKEKKIIVFDLDGTIVRLAVDWISLKEHLQQEYSRIYKEKCDFESVSACLSNIAEREDEKVLQKFFDIIRQYELENIRNSKPIEEIVYFIKNLEQFGIGNQVKLAILSLNVRKTIIQALKIAKILENFDLIIGREDVRSWKPAPLGLYKIRNYYNVKKEVMIYFGDMEKDVLTGENAGIEAYYIDDLILFINKIRKKLLIKNSEEILLYAPTFREYPIQNPLNEKFLRNLDNFLIRENKILLYKPHPFEEKIDLSNYKNVKSIDPNVDIMDLLVVADLLITDYSGVFFDYLLTLRPILFFPYDLEKYTEARDFFYDYHSLVPGPIVMTGEQLISKLEKIQEWGPQYIESRLKARDKFNEYHDGKAIQRIIKFLDLKLEKPIRPILYPKIRIERPVGRFNKIFNSILEFISKKVGMNIKHIISYPLSKLFSAKVYDNLLVFGSTNGQAFAGNPKVIFQYLCEHSNYHCVWITGSEKIYMDLKRRKYNVVLNKDIIKTIKTLKAAKYIFISHGFGDIFYIDFSPNSQLIHLAHGISFKKGGHDLETTFMPFVEKWMNKMLVDHMNLLIDSSEETKRHKMTRFSLPPNRIAVTGYPRNDILVNHTEELDNKIKEKLGIKKGNDVILFAPTFRDYEYKPPLTEAFLKKLEEFLIAENKYFLYKPHPFTQNIDLSQYKRIISIERNVDILDLLIIADVLITDYSSVFYDYLLTMRPMIFYADDLDKYTEVRDFYYDYESFVPGPLVRTSEQLIETLKNLNQWEPRFKEKRKVMRDQFNKFHDGRATERIVELLKLETY